MMERTEILTAMSELKLYGMKAAFDEIITTAVKRQHEPQHIVGDLLTAEITEKQARSIRYQITIAKLPLAKDVDDFRFDNTPINETLVRDLARGNFLAHQRNVVLVGGTGTGKTHLAIAIARACIRDGARGRFFNVVDLVNKLEAEGRSGRQGRLADYLCRKGFVVLDELGYLPFAQSGGQLLFHLISIRSTKGEDESRRPPICSYYSAAPSTGRTGRAGGAAQAASRRSVRDRRDQRRLTSTDRRAEHGACGWPIADAWSSLHAWVPPRAGERDQRLPHSGGARWWRCAGIL
jgi:DNA replication protein DnaC